MKFTNLSTKLKLQEARVMHIKNRIKSLANATEVTLAMLHEANVFSDQLSDVEKSTNLLFDTLLQQDQMPEDYEENTFFEYHNNFVSLISDTRSIILTFVADNVDHSVQTAVVSHMNVKLPKINLPTFSGQWDEWPTFSQLYLATIHDNHALADVEKFQYLTGCLTGEALKLVKNLPVSGENYVIAWESLKSQYQNNRKLTTMYINRILELPLVNPSHIRSLHSFVAAFNENARALDALGHNVTHNNPILVVILMKKLDLSLRTKFENTNNQTKSTLPGVKELMGFLSEEATKMECALDMGPKYSYSHVTPKSPVSHSKQWDATPQKSAFVSNSLRSLKQCVLCDSSSHSIYTCSQFLEAHPRTRQQIVKDKQLCFNCLGLAHKLINCASTNTCAKCGRKHHTLLHYESNSEGEPLHTSSSENAQDVQFVGLSARPHQTTTILLATTMVKFYGSNGNSVVLRCLLDNAAQASFITEAALQTLNLPRRKVVERVSGLSTKTVPLRGAVTCRMQSITHPEFEIRQDLLVVSQITSELPRAAVDSCVRGQLGSLPLADPHFDQPGRIDVLLGADVYARTCMSGRLELGNHLPVVLESKFGWVILGECPDASASNAPNPEYVSMFIGVETSLDSILKKFWECEEPPHSQVKPYDVMYCEKHFDETHLRENSGRYKVRLPVKPNGQELGNSRIHAETRFYALEKKLTTQPVLRGMYQEFMKDYRDSSHMELYDPECRCTTISNITECYIAHHGVMKASSSTTKLRVVFDGSAKTSNGLSLNDILLPGPKLQNEIMDVILRFRLYRIVFTCDIKQMYRQILVNESDRPYQLILWRDHPSEPLSTYQLNTVTYGLSSSPFLAICTLQQLAKDEGHQYPLAARVLQSHVFVDDIITGANTVGEACHLKEDLINLLSLGGFELHKFSSNHSVVLDDVPLQHRETPKLLQFATGPIVNVLGLQWNPEEDKFSYNLNLCTSKATKRIVLSQIARIYDPMGWLSPVVVWAKVLMQWFWVKGLGWDDPLPSEPTEQWNRFTESLTKLKNLHLPRFILSHTTTVELHGFSDASERAYAAVVYLRTTSVDGDVSVHILMAKSRVAPLKQVSLPRLELCGAYLLAKLMFYCNTFLSQHVNLTATQAWSDSTVTLTWIKTPPYLLKTFVANRVAQIHDWVPPSVWRHVPSKDNPADCASRGILPHQLLSHPLWWQGPEWLTKPREEWPCSSLAEIEIPEVKSLQITLVTTRKPPDELPVFRRCSWQTLIHVMAYVIRFINHVRRTSLTIGALSVVEIEHATRVVCRCIQQICFHDDIQRLKGNAVCSTRFQRLSPFLDEHGVVRVGGRLVHARIEQSAKHPIVLPKDHPVVASLVDYYHQVYLHAGPQQLQFLISQRFWILSARSLIRCRVFKCIRCFRCRPVNQSPLMGDLPPDRVTRCRPFERTGVDYAGPITIRLNKLRRSITQKAYLSIFICFVTKAVHIEVVTDLTADSFVAALTRFVSRRGLCNSLHSDCGTNFVGAAKQLHHAFSALLKSSTLMSFASDQSINFHFIPPTSPHQGGLWEAAVKSAKYHLRRVIGNQILTLEELSTLCARVEAVLNSRPLTPCSSDPSDLTALTPGHFLIGAPLVSVPDTTDDDSNICLTRRWKMVCSLANQFWRNWQRGYLQQLQPRSKWQKQQPNLTVGDLVLIGEERTPPQCWCLARITKVYPGKDGVVRVADVRTEKGREVGKKGQLRRPVHKLYRLPVE